MILIEPNPKGFGGGGVGRTGIEREAWDFTDNILIFYHLSFTFSMSLGLGVFNENNS